MKLGFFHDDNIVSSLAYTFNNRTIKVQVSIFVIKLKMS